VRKGLSMIIANDAVKTIGSDRSTATILRPYGEQEELPMMSKTDLANTIMTRIADLLNGRAR